jgi:hypothetical protein
MKEAVYTKSVTDLQNLPNRISKAIWTIKSYTLERTCIVFDCRLDMVRAARSAEAGTVYE